MFYFDTSVIAAYYCPEQLSDKAEAALTGCASPVISQLTELEMASALSRKIREKTLSTDDGNRILNTFQAHIGRRLYRRVALEHCHYRKALGWIAQFNTPLRALDGLHLALAAAEDIPLVTADHHLAEAARHFGVQVRLLC
ncbi:MAG: type II toxin-antitoxin system VapC family toxin [Desulfobulbaceae bacterium]|nr:type II toxin-antitoxin system VapC family toxin [Desulfobulbaceae bacterium]